MKKKTNSTILSVAAIAAFYATTSYVPATAAEYNIGDYTDLKNAIVSLTAVDDEDNPQTVASGDTVNFTGDITDAGTLLTPNASLDSITIDGKGGSYESYSSSYSAFTTNSAKANQVLNINNLTISGFNTAIETAANGVINLSNVTFGNDTAKNTTDINNLGNININGAVTSTGAIVSSGTLTINSTGSLTSTDSLSSTGTITSSGTIVNKGSFSSGGSGDSSIATYKQTAADGATASASTAVTNGSLTVTGAEISIGTVSVGNASGGNNAILKLSGTGNSISTGILIDETGTLEATGGAQYELTTKDTWKGTAKVSGAGSKLTIGNVAQTGTSKLVAESGTLESNLDKLSIKTGSDIKTDATVSLKAASELEVDGGKVVLDDGDSITNLVVTEKSGDLELSNIKTGTGQKVAKISASGTGSSLKLTNATLATTNDSIAKEVTLTADNLTIENTSADGVTLNTDDTWKGALKLKGGKLTIAGATQATGATLAAESGALDIGDSATQQTIEIAGSGNSIASDVAVNLVNGKVDITGGSLTLTNDNDTITKGELNLSDGQLTVTGLNTNADAKIAATGGVLELTTVKLANNSDSIADNVKATVSGLEINKGGTTSIILKGTGSYADTISGNVTLTNGNLEIGGYAANTRSGAFIANGGTLTISDTMVFDKSADAIASGADLVINKNVSVAGGSFAIGSGDTLNTAATLSVDGGLLDLAGFATSASTGAIQANTGSVNVTGASTLAKATDVIKKDVNLNVKDADLSVSASTAKTDSAPATGVYLNSGDKIANGKKINVSGTGVLTADGFATGSADDNKGSINATGGEVDIASGGLTLGSASDNINGAKVNMAGDLTINDGNVALASTDTLTSGNLSITNGTLSLTGIDTTDGVIFTASKTGTKTQVTLDGVVLGNSGDSIDGAVKTIIGSNGLEIKLTNTGDTQNVALVKDNTTLTGDVTLTNGNLSVSGFGTETRGAIKANGGKLTIAGATTLSGNDIIASSANVNVLDGDLTIASGKENYLNSGDTIANGKKVELVSGGKLTTDGFATTAVGGSLQATNGTLIVGTGGLTLANAADTIAAEAGVTVTGPLNVAGGNGVTLNTGDTWTGKITQTGGTLNLAGGLSANGLLSAEGGNLNIGTTAAQNITLSTDSIIKTAATLSILNGSQITVDGGELQLNKADIANASTNGAVVASSGKVKLEGASATDKFSTEKVSLNLADSTSVEATLTNVILNNASDIINAKAVVTAQNLAVNNGNVTLNTGDTVTGSLAQTGGTLTLSGISQSATEYTTSGGTLNVSNLSQTTGQKITATGTGNLNLNAGTMSASAVEGVNVKVAAGTNLDVNGSVTLSGTTDEWSGNVQMTDSTDSLTIKDIEQGSGATLNATNGSLNISSTTGTKQIVNIGTNSEIGAGAGVTTNNATINVSGTGKVSLNSGDSLTNTNVAVTGGEFTVNGINTTAGATGVSFAATTGGSVDYTNVQLNNDSDTIAAAVKANVNGLTINNANADGVTLTGGTDGDTIGANGVTLTAGKLIVSGYDADNAKGGKLVINGGTAELTNVVLNNANDVIATGANVKLDGVTINNTNANGVTLTGGTDTIGANGVTLSKGTLNVGGYDASATRGAIVANTNTSTANFNVIDDLTLKSGDNITLDAAGDSITSGKTLTNDGGTLTLNGYSTAADGTKGIIDAKSGVLHVTADSTLANAADKIASGASVTVDADKTLEINITNAAGVTDPNVTLTDADTINGTVKLTKGNLSVAGVNGTVQVDGGTATVSGMGASGALKANAGDVVISADTTISGNSIIKKDANVAVTGGNLTIASNQDNYLNSGDTIADGKKVEVATGGKLTTEGFATTADGGSLQATGGTLIEKGLTLNNSNDTIAKAAATTIDGNLNINAGSVTLNGINSDGATDKDTLKDGTITLNGGALTVGGFADTDLGNVTLQADKGTFTLESGHFKGNIQELANVDLQSGSTFHSTGETTLDAGDTWNGDIVIESGHVIIKDGITQGGKLSADGGIMEIGYGASSQTVNIDAGQTVTERTQVKLTNGTINVNADATDPTKQGTLYLNGNDSAVGAGDGDVLTKGTINVAGGKLIMSNLSTNNDATNNVKLTATKGDVSLTNVKLQNDNDSIAAEVNATINGLEIDNSNITVTLDGSDASGSYAGDNWNGNIKLTSGTLNLEGVEQKDASSLTANGGTLNIGSGSAATGKQSLTVNATNTIANAVDVNIKAGSAVTIADGGTLTLDHSNSGTGTLDTLAGDISSAGSLTLNKIDNGGKLTSSAGSLTATDSNVTIGEGSSIAQGSTVKITGADENTKGGSLTIKIDTAAHTDGTGVVTLNSGDTVNTTINLGTTATDGGTLTITGGATIKDGTTLVAKSGTLNIADTQELIIGKSTADSTTSSIAKEVGLNIGGGTKITVKDGGAVTLNDIAATYAAGDPTSDTWTGEIKLEDGGNLNIENVTAKTGYLTATGGSLTIDRFVANSASDSIAEAVAVSINGDFLVASGNVTLNGQDSALGANDKDTFTSGVITVSKASATQKGNLTISDVTTTDSTVQLVADDGSLNLSNVNLNSASDDIGANAKVTITGTDGLTITNAAAKVVLNDGDTWNGSKIALDGGKLSLLGADQGTGTITTVDGATLNIGTDGTNKADQTLNIGLGSSIADGTTVTLDGGTNGSTINVTAGGTVSLSQGAGQDTLTKGTLNVDGGTLTLKDVTTTDNVKLTSTANGGTLNLDNVTLGGSSDTIKNEVKAVITNGITINNTDANGVVLTGGDDTIAGGVKLTNGNLTIGGFDTSTIGAIQASGGSLTVDGAKLTLKDAADEIAGGATVVVKSDLDVLTANGTTGKYTVTLDSSDSIAKTATVKVDGGSMKVDGFKTAAKADAADKGGLNIVSGKLDIGTNGLELNNNDDRILTAADVTLGGNLTVKDGQVELDSTDTLTSGIIKVDGDNAKLTATGVATKADNSVSLNAANGELIADGLTLNSTSDTIAAAVNTTVGTGGLIINKTDTANGVTLNSGDTWNGKVTLNDGNLTLLDVTQGSGEINATGGSLTLGNGTDKNANITVAAATGTNSIAEAVSVNLQKGSSLTAGASGEVVMDGANDTWNGALNVTTGGTLSLLGISQGASATLAATGGTLNVGRDAGSGVSAAVQTLKITGSGNSVSADTNVNLAANSSITTESGGALEINTGDTWKGTLINNADGTLTLSGFGYDSVQNGGKLIVNDGNVDILGASVVIGTGSIIKDAATVVIAATKTVDPGTGAITTTPGGSIKILKDGATAGSVVLNDGDIWNGEILLGYTDNTDPSAPVVTKGGDLTIGKATTGTGAVLKAESGNLTIDNAGGDPLKITGDSFIKYDVNTNLKADSSLQIDNGDVVLSDNSTWDSTALVTLNNGKLQYVGIKQNGVLKGNGGTLIIGATTPTPDPDFENTVLTVKGDSLIKDEVKVTVNGVLNIEEGTINLDGTGAGQDTLAGGKIVLNQTGTNDANLKMSNLSTTNTYLQALKGNLNLSDVILDNSNDFIDYAVSFSMNTNDLNIQKGTVKLDAEDPILASGSGDKSISLNQADGAYAMLGVDGLKTGVDATTGKKLTINLNKGNLEIEGRGLELNNATDTIKQDIVTLIKGDLTMNAGKVYLDGGDTTPGSERDADIWESGNIKLTQDAKLQFKDFEADSTGATKMTMTKTAATDNPSVELIGSKVNVADASDIAGGTMVLDANSVINLGAGSYQLDTMKSSGTVNTINGAYDNYNATDLVVLNPEANTYASVMDGTNTVITDGNAKFAIDLFAREDSRNFNSDTFSGTNLTSDDRHDSDAVITISDWTLNGRITRGDAPIDHSFYFKNMFDYENIDDNIKFAATDKEQLTPIGYYRLFANEDKPGDFTFALTRYNKQVFRGQLVTQAQFRNQQSFDDMVTSNVLLHGSRKVADYGSNRFALASPNLGPYQYTAQEGGLWMKSYADIEKLHFNHDINANNVAYGVVVGADFPMIEMKKGWKFIPTPYIGYNGAHQAFNDVSTYQYGGQLGFMGTFMKGNFISSNTLYGGGYYNDMHVDGVVDSTANWFWGTANKMAYNWTIKRHFTIQPTMFFGYTMYGPQNYHTEFGEMSMKTGMLNGINVAPGMNFIYAKKDWSVYAGWQYFYNINDQVSGRAGNVDLPSLRMKRGYIQYGLGATKNIKDELAGYAQVMWRNGGRTGLAFQMGLQYCYDVREIGNKIHDSYNNFKEAREQKAEQKREAKRASIITTKGVKAVPVSNVEKPTFKTKVKNLFKRNK